MLKKTKRKPIHSELYQAILKKLRGLYLYAQHKTVFIFCELTRFFRQLLKNPTFEAIKHSFKLYFAPHRNTKYNSSVVLFLHRIIFFSPFTHNFAAATGKLFFPEYRFTTFRNIQRKKKKNTF